MRLTSSWPRPASMRPNRSSMTMESRVLPRAAWWRPIRVLACSSRQASSGSPIPEVRVGFSVASPSFAFVILNRVADNVRPEPASGHRVSPWGPQCPSRRRRGVPGRAWRLVGVEPGNFRFGIAYVGNWGWVEANLIIQWRLRTPDLDIDLQPVVNGRIGSAFRLTKFVNLGVGLFTDLSPIDRLEVAPFATSDIDFYGAHFSFRSQPRGRTPVDPMPTRGRAAALQSLSAFGTRTVRGRPLGVLPAGPHTVVDHGDGANGKINEIAINLGANISF